MKSYPNPDFNYANFDMVATFQLVMGNRPRCFDSEQQRLNQRWESPALVFTSRAHGVKQNVAVYNARKHGCERFRMNHAAAMVSAMTASVRIHFLPIHNSSALPTSTQAIAVDALGARA